MIFAEAKENKTIQIHPLRPRWSRGFFVIDLNLCRVESRKLGVVVMIIWPAIEVHLGMIRVRMWTKNFSHHIGNGKTGRCTLLVVFVILSFSIALAPLRNNDKWALNSAGDLISLQMQALANRFYWMGHRMHGRHVNHDLSTIDENQNKFSVPFDGSFAFDANLSSRSDISYQMVQLAVW